MSNAVVSETALINIHIFKAIVVSLFYFVILDELFQMKKVHIVRGCCKVFNLFLFTQVSAETRFHVPK